MCGDIKTAEERFFQPALNDQPIEQSCHTQDTFKLPANSSPSPNRDILENQPVCAPRKRIPRFLAISASNRTSVEPVLK